MVWARTWAYQPFDGLADGDVERKTQNVGSYLESVRIQMSCEGYRVEL